MNVPAWTVEGTFTVPVSGVVATLTVNPLKSISGEGESSVTLMTKRAVSGALAGV